MGLGGSWSSEPYSSAQVDEAAAAVDAALEAGITLFDHADIYRGGKSEAVFGEVLADTPGLRERIRLQTKCGIRLNEHGLEGYYDLSRDAILDRVNESLARLRTDYVDVLMLHRPDPLMDPAEVASAVGQLMAEGKVRALGVSNMSGAQIEVLQDRLETPGGRQPAGDEPAQTRLAGKHRAGQPRRGHGLQLPARHRGALRPARDHPAGLRRTGPGPLHRGAGPGAVGRGGSDHRARGAAGRGEETTGEAILLGWLMKHPAGIAPVIGTANPDRIRACADAAAVAAAMTRTEWYRLWVTARGSNIP